MECKLNKRRNKDEGVVKLDGQDIPKDCCFQNLGSIMYKNGKRKKHMDHRIRAWLMKQKSALGALRDSENAYYEIRIFCLHN